MLQGSRQSTQGPQSIRLNIKKWRVADSKQYIFSAVSAARRYISKSAGRRGRKLGRGLFAWNSREESSLFSTFQDTKRSLKRRSCNALKWAPPGEGPPCTSCMLGAGCPPSSRGLSRLWSSPATAETHAEVQLLLSHHHAYLESRKRPFVHPLSATSCIREGERCTRICTGMHQCCVSPYNTDIITHACINAVHRARARRAIIVSPKTCTSFL